MKAAAGKLGVYLFGLARVEWENHTLFEICLIVDKLVIVHNRRFISLIGG